MAGPFPYVLSVVAAQDDALALAENVRASIAMETRAGGIDWLAERHAFDIPFFDRPDQTLAAARAAAAGSLADVNVVAAEKRRKGLLVADMDSTIITCECLDELADMAGLKPRIAAITARAMNGEIEFASALRERVALLKGLELTALERVFRERVKLTEGAAELVLTMRRAGAHTILVSGGFSFFTERVGRAAGFHEERANRLEDDGLTLTGHVGEPILGREAKRETLEQAVTRMGIGFSESLAVGDGANDLDMIRKAGLGVAFHAKPIVAQVATARIDHCDLTALLYLQGYRKNEIVSPA